jgi:hypothetical protein
MSKRGLIAFVVGSLVSLAIVMGPASAASAASATKFFVSSTVAVTGGDNNCATAGYKTVQSAVIQAQTYELANPSAVATIALCGGVFPEQVTVTNASLKFVDAAGTPASTIELPAAVGNDQTTGLSDTPCTAGDSGAGVATPQSVVEICQTGSTLTTVSITGITIEGNWPTSVCYDSLYGILVGGGAKLDLTDSTVDNIGGPDTDGCQGGVAVQVGFSPTGEVGHATLTGDSIGNYQKNGITVDGAGSSATITGGSVTGGSDAQIAQNGIQVSSGATAKITGENITANQCELAPPACGTDPWSDTQSTGVLLVDEGTPTSVESSSITSNDVGIYNVQSSTPTTAGVTISGNTVSSSDEAIAEDSGWSKVTDNSLGGNLIGIWIPQYAAQPISPEITASGNVITDNSVAEVQVESDNKAGDFPVLATIDHNDLSGNSIGVQNNSGSIVTAENDFWGGTEGPSGTGIGPSSDAAADPNVSFFPWSETVSDTATPTAAMATTGDPSTCTKSGTNISSAVADVVLCSTGPGRLTYTGPGPVLVRGNGSDVITLGTATTPATGISLILNGGTSTVAVGNNSSGLYQEWNGATATFTGGGSLTLATSALVTG